MDRTFTFTSCLELWFRNCRTVPSSASRVNVVIFVYQCVRFLFRGFGIQIDPLFPLFAVASLPAAVAVFVQAALWVCVYCAVRYFAMASVSLPGTVSAAPFRQPAALTLRSFFLGSTHPGCSDFSIASISLDFLLDFVLTSRAIELLLRVSHIP